MTIPNQINGIYAANVDPVEAIANAHDKSIVGE